jgi:hypothetical protein
LKAFEGLPDEARVWLFAAERAFEPKEWRTILERVRHFIADWRSHGRPVASAAEVLEGRVLAVAGVITPDDLNAGVSGCGIDSMMRAAEGAALEAGCRWAGNLDVLYDDGDSWRAVSRSEFRQLVAAGAITLDTPVIDLTPGTVGALRRVGVARPAGEAWHAAAFWPSVTPEHGPFAR